MARAAQLSDRDYARLLSVRTNLRQFEHWSAEHAGAHGLTASQHQLLLAIRGHDETAGPTIGQAADYLMIRHNTAVELVNRVQELGLLIRSRDDTDHRAVRLALTAEGRARLAALTAAHVAELSRLTPMIDGLIAALSDGSSK